MTDEKQCGISADRLRIADGTPLPDLITHLKHDAIEELVTILIELLRQQGFTFDELLNGLAGYCHREGLEKIEKLLEEASNEYLTETKRQ